MSKRLVHWVRLVFTATVLWGGVAAADNLKPFVLAESMAGDVSVVAGKVRDKLAAAGFDVLGSYRPYDGVEVLAVTSDGLKQLAAGTDFGAFGAVPRVTVTKNGEQVQVAYNNPVYLANAYRMQGDAKAVADRMAAAIGHERTFGSEEGLSAEKLREYHYKFMMPYFDDRIELVRHGSHKEAVDKVEAALAAGQGGASKVYRVDIPGQETTVFGVAMTDECSGDRYIMERIDFQDLKSSGHLPYEMVVKGGTVYTLPAEFRIAINFPDLSMMGSNSFASIMCAPGAIKSALTLAAGGSAESRW